jgi:hypothetical protein
MCGEDGAEDEGSDNDGEYHGVSEVSLFGIFPDIFLTFAPYSRGFKAAFYGPVVQWIE